MAIAQLASLPQVNRMLIDWEKNHFLFLVSVCYAGYIYAEVVYGPHRANQDQHGTQRGIRENGDIE